MQETAMSERALAFLEEWTAENIEADDDAPEDNSARAKQLADQFLAAAAAEGIPKAEIDDVIDDLPGFMEAQIEEANEREEDDAADHEIEDEVENEIGDEEDDEDDDEDDEDKN
jgi:hypothetical protein